MTNPRTRDVGPAVQGRKRNAMRRKIEAALAMVSAAGYHCERDLDLSRTETLDKLIEQQAERATTHQKVWIY